MKGRKKAFKEREEGSFQGKGGRKLPEGRKEAPKGREEAPKGREEGSFQGQGGRKLLREGSKEAS